MQILLNKIERYVLPFSILMFGLIISFSFVFVARAQTNPFDSIEYPIEDLGGCEDRRSCKSYCDDISNLNACLDFAESHGLMPKQELEQARKFGTEKTPGDCKNRSECTNYCENIENLEECLAFAEDHEVLDKEGLSEARQISQALQKGTTLPGGCTNKKECEAYCSITDHIEECVAFAETAGFMSQEEALEIRKIAPLMARGETPGGCTNKEQCKTYCENESNKEECVAFAEKAGFMSPEQARKFRETGGRGPGNCKGEKECRSFCENPDNQRECIAFAKKHGFEGEFKDDIKRMDKDMSEIRKALNSAPQEVFSCLNERLGSNFEKEILGGDGLLTSQDRDVVRTCFEQGISGSREHVQNQEHNFDEKRESNFRPHEKDILNCLVQIHGQKIANDFKSGNFNPGADTKRKIEECMDRGENKNTDNHRDDFPREDPYDQNNFRQNEFDDDFKKNPPHNKEEQEHREDNRFENFRDSEEIREDYRGDESKHFYEERFDDMGDKSSQEKFEATHRPEEQRDYDRQPEPEEQWVREEGFEYEADTSQNQHPESEHGTPIYKSSTNPLDLIKNLVDVPQY